MTILSIWPRLNILIFLLIFRLKVFLGIFLDSGVLHFGFIDFDGVEVTLKPADCSQYLTPDSIPRDLILAEMLVASTYGLCY